MAGRTTPYGAFNFLVEISGVTPGAQAPLGGFSDVSGLNTEITIAEYRNGNEKLNHVRKVPGIHKTGDVTLKRGVVNSKSLWDWIKAVRRFGPEAKKEVIITLLSESGENVQSWTLSEAIPLKYTGPTLAAKGGGDVAMEELVISAEDIELQQMAG